MFEDLIEWLKSREPISSDEIRRIGEEVRNEPEIKEMRERIKYLEVVNGVFEGKIHPVKKEDEK